MVFHLGKKNRQAFGAGGFLDSVDSSLAGPFRQQAGEVEKAKKREMREPVRHYETIEAHAKRTWQLPPRSWGKLSPPAFRADACPLFGPQDHLGAPEERDPRPAAFDADLGVPHLGRAAEVHRPCLALDGAVPGGADEVGLQLDRGEAARALGQVRDAAVAAARVR